MKQIFLFLSLFFAFQTVTAQEVWNACNSTVNVIPAPSYDSTFVLEAPSRAALQKGMANWVPASSGGGASYLVYTALLTQSGTDAPVATVLENTLGVTVTWSYGSAGSYTGTYSATLSGDIFVDEKKRYLVFPFDGAITMALSSNTSTIAISTYDPVSETGIDGVMTSVPIQIRLYQ